MRADIEKYLGTVSEASAKAISDKIGVDRLHVARELNAMVSSGIIERRMQGGKSRAASEYVYWLATAKVPDGVEVHPTTLPKTAVATPKTMNTNIESELRQQISAVQDQLRTAQAALDEEKAAHAKTLKNADDGRISELQKALDQEREAHALNVKELNQVIAKLDASEREAKALRARCASLQTQIDQYDERKRFDTWFSSRPENSGQPSLVKEAMWDSWLERSKMVEVAA